MAEKLGLFEHSETLFVNPDGSPMIFYMRPCNDRQNLKPWIAHGGGKITSKVTKGCCKLAERGSIVRSDDYLSARYIEACVKQNKLLDTADFRIRPGSTVVDSADMDNHGRPGDGSPETMDCFDDDDSLAPASYAIDTVSRCSKGRQKYTPEDDINIITFIVDKNLARKTSGKAIWRMMELKKVTCHTAESMSCRYRKVILHNLHHYKDDVDPMWLKELKPTPKNWKQEFAYEELFRDNCDKFLKKRPLEMNIKASEMNKEKENLSKGKRADHKQEGYRNDTGSEWLNKKNSPLKSHSKNNAIADQTEKNEERTEMSPKDDTLRFTPDSVLDDIDKTVQVAATNPNTKTKNRREFRSTSVKQKTDEHFSSSDSPVRVSDSPSKVRVRKRQIVELDDGRITSSQTDDYSDTDFEEYAQKSWKTYDRDFVKSQRCTNSPLSNSSVIKFDHLKEKSVKVSASSEANGKSSPTKARGKSRTAKRQAKSATKQIDAPSMEESVDSVDDYLMEYINKGTVDEGRPDVLDSRPDVSDSEESAASDSVLADKTVVEKATAHRHTTNITRQTACSSKTASSDRVNKDADDSDDDECLAACKRIAAEYGLAVWRVTGLLYWHSGDVQRTINYINWGPFSMDPPPWNYKDDGALGVEDAMLKVKYSKKDVRARKLFLYPRS